MSHVSNFSMKNQFRQSLSKIGDYWLGLTRPCGSITDALAFRWIDSTVITDSNWGNNQPDNIIPIGFYTQPTCTYIDNSNNQTWNDVPCDATKLTVCQLRLNERNISNFYLLLILM